MKLTEAQIEEREKLRQAEMKVIIHTHMQTQIIKLIIIIARENWKKSKDAELNGNEKRKPETMRW